MLPKFELYMPDTLEEACRLKAAGAEVVAGGTDVFVNMHGGKDRSGQVVDIKNIPALQGHTFDEAQGLDLGALTTHREIELWDVIKQRYRALSRSAPGGPWGATSATARPRRTASAPCWSTTPGWWRPVPPESGRSHSTPSIWA